MPAVAALALVAATTAFTIKSQTDAVSERHKLQNQAEAEKATLDQEQADIATKAQQDYTDKINSRRARSGPDSTIMNGPQGVLQAAPIAKASLQGKTLLG